MKVILFICSVAAVLLAPWRAGGAHTALVDASYSEFHGNPHLSERMRAMIAPYLLPLNHPMKPVIDHLFSQTRVTESMQSLNAAGFEVIASMPRSFVVVARHAAVPGYVFKLYLDCEERSKHDIPNWQWLTQRCIGASKIRELIAKQGIKHFFVPDKWIYILPVQPEPKGVHAQPIVVIASDIEPLSEEDCKQAWRTVMTREHLQELHEILKRGYSTTQMANIPYTKRGQFAFMDTEYPCRSLQLLHLGKYMSNDMAKYWKRLIEK